MLKRAQNKLTDVLLNFQYHRLARRNSFDPRNALIICGDPRGGTTWLAHLVKEVQGTALIWEPLMISKVKEFARLGFEWRQYIPEQEQWPEARAIMERVFKGQLLSSYLCQQSSPKSVREAKHLLVKFCRANQLLPWLTREFAFRVPPIYLVRHPCAVVASQLKQGGWRNVHATFSLPNGRYHEFYSKHAAYLGKINSVEKNLAATWCMCNAVPLSHPDNNKRWITLTYESLLMNGGAELERIERRWNLRFPDKSYNRLAEASSTTVEGSPIGDGKAREQLRYWQTELSNKQIDDILSVLDYFKISLYNNGPMPLQSFLD